MLSRFRSRSAIVLLIVLAFMGGAGSVCIKVALREVSPFYFCFLRFSLAFVLLLPRLRVTAPLREEQRSSTALMVLLIGAGLNLGNVALFALGIPHTDVALSQLLYVLATPLVFVVGLCAGFETATRAHVAGVVLGIGGAAVAVGQQLGTGVQTEGLLFILGAVLCYSGYILAARRLHRSWTSAQQTVTMSAIVAVGTLLISLCVGERWTSPLEFSASALFGLLGAAAVGSAGYYYLATALVKSASPAVASYALLLQPFTAYLVGLPFFDSRLSVLSAIGALASVFGAFLVVPRPKERVSAAAPEA